MNRRRPPTDSTPTNADIVGTVYKLGPNGATFEPPVNLTFAYDDSNLSDGITAKDLKIAFWDETANQWINLETENIDTVNHTITAKISHFSTYSVLGYIPAPAQFTMSAAIISPLSVKTNEPVNVAVTVFNIGGRTGLYSVVLKANGILEGSKTVLLDGGARAQVEFTLTKDAANTYILDVNGQSASFIMTNPAAPAPEPIQTLIPTVETTTPSAVITPVPVPSTTVVAVPSHTFRLALLVEVIGTALVLIGLMAIVVLLRRKHLLRKE